MVRNSFFHFARLVLQERSKEHAAQLSHLKYYRQWKKSLGLGRNAIDDELPWITFPAIDFIKKHLGPESRVFEYGGGGSSLFFMNRAKETITIEHHKEWFERLLAKTRQKNNSSWVGKLIPPEKKEENLLLDPSDPSHYYTNEEAYIDCTFKSYVTYIDNYPDNYFDMVMIDGRSRASCIWHSIPKIKPGGFLIVDNSNRRNYFRGVQEKLEAGFQLVSDQKAPSPYLNYLTQTAIWRKK